MARSVDEGTPLLQGKRKRTPLPWSQFAIVMLLQVSEPLTMLVISPFAPQLIRDIGVTDGNESQVGYYVGLLQTVFFLTQTFTVLQWSWMSDFVGRKPVVLIGLFGLTISTRCLSGALNGNAGTIKSLTAELTDETNIAQAYAFIPIAWSTGGSAGPFIGGFLSRPADHFDGLRDNKFLRDYPYFLPCAIPAAYTALMVFVTHRFLKETHKSPIPITRLLGIQKDTIKLKSPTLDLRGLHDSNRPLRLRALLTPPVIIATGNYAIVSMVEMAFRAIHPLFLSTPIELGGLGLPPSFIGKILGMYGIFNGIFQMLFFTQIHDRAGPKMTFLAGVVSAFPCFLAFPIISYMAKAQGLSVIVWCAVCLQTLISAGMGLSFGAIFIFITAAAPNRASLGATNGFSQMTVSLMRAVGPAAATSLFSLSIERNWLDGYLVYYVLTAVVGLAVYIGSMLPKKPWTP